MSTDNKRILLTLFITIDVLLGVLIFKTNNTGSSIEAENTLLKSMPNIIDVEKNVLETSQQIEEEIEPIVYDGLTYEQLVIKLNNTLNDDLGGKGDVIASYALELGVDPYLVTAIMMHETGCEWSCSYIVKACNNVGGQKGYGCGDYGYFDTLDDGIRSMIYNIYSNYYVYGLTTPELINPKYAEDYNWSNNVNRYIEKIRNN